MGGGPRVGGPRVNLCRCEGREEGEGEEKFKGDGKDERMDYRT